MPRQRSTETAAGPSTVPAQRRRRETPHFTGLSASARADLLAYVENLKLLNGLSQWIIEIDWTEPADEGADAMIDSTEGRYIAVMWLRKDFAKLERSEIRRILLHEVMHLHFAQLRHTVRSSAEVVLNKDAAEMMKNSAHLAEEYAVDSMSAALAELMPMPTFGRVNRPAD